MNFDIAKDIDITKELLQINESVFSERIGIPRNTIYSWKLKQKQPSRVYLEKLYAFIYQNKIYLNNLKEQSFLYSENNQKIILFHGAKEEIKDNIDLNHSSLNNDFGVGFYTGRSFFQSASFVANYPNSSVYIGQLSLKNNLKIVEYSVDINWMITIAFYRGKLKDFEKSKVLKKALSKLENADVVVAPIADNRMFRIIDDFIEGNITDLQCKSALCATDLGKQYVLVSEEAINNFELINRCYLCDKEKQYILSEKEKFNEISNQKIKYVKREFAGKGKYVEELLV